MVEGRARLVLMIAGYNSHLLNRFGCLSGEGGFACQGFYSKDIGMDENRTQERDYTNDLMKVAVITSAVWFVLTLIVGFIAYRQGEWHVVHCVSQLGIGC